MILDKKSLVIGAVYNDTKIDTEFKTLDVGCGDRPRGDVNCDLYVGKSPHFTDKSHGLIIPKKIPNFVRCDAHFLPFRNNSFRLIIAYHVLEHCHHPFNVLREFHRVASHKVVVEVPNLSKVLFRESPTHLFTWSKYSLCNLMEQFFSEVEIYDTFLRIKGRILSKTSPLGKFFCKNILAVGVKLSDQRQLRKIRLSRVP